jgi:diguanylate cyclase (GGDEF)-like protein
MPAFHRTRAAERRLRVGLLLAAIAFPVAGRSPALPLPRVPAAATSAELSGRLAFRLFGDDDGLGNTTVECLLQDRDGLLWIGTQDGLFRFDGHGFARFGREEGLPSSRVNTLHQGADGRLYAGTRTGLAVLADERFLPLGPARGLPEADVPDQGIASDATGDLYVATPQGLFVGRPGSGGRFVRIPPADRSDLPEVTGLHRAPDGSLVFARGGRLFRRAAGRTVEIGRPAGLPDGERIDQTATDGEGRLWVRTLSRLWSLRPAGGVAARRFVRDDAGLPEGVASGRLALDDRGRLLVPTSRGLAWRDGGAWRRIGRREGLPAEAVLSALVDREGSLWIGLAGAGLAQQLGRGAFASWGSAEGLSHDVVWSIARQPGRGPLWVGTEDGLDRMDLETGEIRVFRVGDGLAGGTVYALVPGPDGSLWAGSWPGGVTRFGPAAGQVRRYGVAGMAAADLKVIALFFDRSGDLWMGARSGAYRLAAGSAARTFEPVPLPGGDDRDSIYGFAELPESPGTAVWAVGRYGLVRLTGPTPRRFRRADGLLSDFLSSVAPAAAGEPWSLIAGYREALGAARVKVDGDRLRVTPLDRPAGLSFDKVLFLGRDAGGALWVGGGAGVDVFRAGAPAARHYGRAAGLITEDMSQNAFLAEPDGTVWLGTSRGLVRYRPGLEPPPPPPPSTLLTAAIAGDRRLDLSRLAVLGRDERDLAVSWTAPTFLDPARVRFRYRLAGREEAFHETLAREVRFPALPTGDYRLEVVAVSGSGVAGTRPAVLALSVLPAWWERPWAWAAGVLGLAFGLAGAVRLRTAKLEAERRRLETAVAERSAALAQAVEELEVASSTDFLTGLHNRRYFYSRLDAEVERTLRSAAGAPGTRGRDLLVYLVDLDLFKSVNDRHGHDRGDRLLIEVAHRLRTVIRSGDLLVRWGGEEFLILARGADRTDGAAFAGRILAAVGDRPYDLGGGVVLRRTCSVGWAPFPWFSDAPGELGLEQVLVLADHALYRAKGDGRDRAVGALPIGAKPDGGPDGWWQRPLEEAAGARARLERTERPGREPAAAAKEG